ncbi:MAG: hypothetical protein JST00_13740 [Deltaproteobacteria bacterium]|nr:hypothetical protein [Deltaproteobacteria bacterium]
MSARSRLLALIPSMLALACRDPSSGGASSGAADGTTEDVRDAASPGDPTRPDSGAALPAAPAAGDVVWIDAPLVTHPKDYVDLGTYLNPAVPRDWTTPVNYADGDVTIRIELVSVSEGTEFPLYYLVGWTAGNGSTAYVRGGHMFQSLGVLEERVPVKELQRVVGGRDVGNAADEWSWKAAFETVNADAWGGKVVYPVSARVRFTLHPKR